MLKEKQVAPQIKLEDQDGNIFDLKKFQKVGKTGNKRKVLIYFYPKDDTPGCTTEACGFRDFRYELQDKGVEIVGISKDTVASHKKFAEKFKLNFKLLSDENCEAIKKYGAWQEKSMYGKKYMGIARISYLINSNGKIEKVYGKVDTKIHANEVLQDAE